MGRVATRDSEDLADVLEVHYLCLLLGFGGRYGAGNRGELAQAMDMTAEKIRRIRGRFSQLSPSWTLPGEKVQPAGRDPWVRKLGIIAAVVAGLMIVLFVVYKLTLGSGVRLSVTQDPRTHPHASLAYAGGSHRAGLPHGAATERWGATKAEIQL